jgi:hypothetical protein
MSRTKKKPYTGSKKFDRTCRNNGSCPYCRANRQYKNNKRNLQAKHEQQTII